MKRLVTSVFLMLIIFTPVFSGEACKTQGREWIENLIDSLLKEVELIPIMINGEKDNRTNIVIIDRWTADDKEPYNKPEIRDEFIKVIHESLIDALTPGDKRAQTAYASYRNSFNVYGLYYPCSPSLEYDLWNFTAGEALLQLNCIPSYPVNKDHGLRVAVALDDEKPVITDSKGEKDVISNLLTVKAKLNFTGAGQHTLKIWMVDPGLVIYKIIIDTGGTKDSYLGPPESGYYKN
jgi:hypothetical protein